MVNGPPYNYITAKPFIISEYDLTVTTDKNRVEQGTRLMSSEDIKIRESC
jgi:hypothetical protein